MNSGAWMEAEVAAILTPSSCPVKTSPTEERIIATSADKSTGKRLITLRRLVIWLPLACGLLIVLAVPRLLTGYFCYVTIDEIKQPSPTSVRLKYHYYVTPNSSFRFEGINGGGGSGTRGLFAWYHYSHGAGGDGYFSPGGESNMTPTILVEEGKTYSVPLNGSLTAYEFKNESTGEIERAEFQFKTGPLRRRR